MEIQRKRIENLIIRYPQLESCEETISKAYCILRESFNNGNKLLIAGNGGSAADSQHIVGELMKSFCKDRALSEKFVENIKNMGIADSGILLETLQGALPAISLSGEDALTTAYSNDCNPLVCFAQQVYGYGKEGDAFLAISTSGNSKNIYYAALTAKAKGMKVIGLLGRTGGVIKDVCDVAIIVPQNETYKIQELHLPIYHTLCLMLEDTFF